MAAANRAAGGAGSLPDYAAVPPSALGPALNEQGTGVEAFTYSTTFTVLQSMRLDLGAGSQVHP